MGARRLRVALAAAVAAPLIVAPVVAQAVSGEIRCADAKRDGPWQILPVEPFRGVEGVSTRDVVTGYAVDVKNPQRVLATNGNTVKTSGTYGCTWDDGLVLDATPDDAIGVSGATSSIVSTTLLPGGAALAAIREGSGAASRPHVALSSGGQPGTWRLSDAGLPAQGAPRLLEAAGDGRTAYLVLSPVADGGSSGGTLPSLPGAPTELDPAGSLYATTDGGRSWELRTPAGALPADGVTGLSVDAANPSLLYVVSAGRLLVSSDGGRSLRDAGLKEVRAVEAMEADEVAVAVNEGKEVGLIQHSTDAGRRFEPRASARDVDSLAYRRGDPLLLGEATGRFIRIDARRDGRPEPVRAPLRPAGGSVRGDRAAKGASFTALAEHALLRWVDLKQGAGAAAPPVVDPLPPLPPPPGRVQPGAQSVTLPVGESRLLDYTLVLPPSPTPVDLVFLIDTSPNMKNYMADLRANLRKIVDKLVDDGIDVKVGLATAGPGPADGEPPYPEVDPTRPDYRKPALYRLLRPVGPVDRQLQQALDGLRTDSAPQNGANKDVLEGQLISLQELILGEGVEEQTSNPAAPTYAVDPGQKAGFRQQQGIRKLIIHATEERFNNPHGTPRKNGKPDIEGVAALLKKAGVQQAGISPVQGGEALDDLRKMARLTGALAPEGGVDCTDNIFLEEGDPLVCQAAAGFSSVITNLIRNLEDEQDVSFVPVAPTPVAAAVDTAALRGIDITRRNELPVRVRVSCLDAGPGTYEQKYSARLRGFEVATAVATVTCTALPVAAVVPPRPDPPAIQEPAPPAGQPAAQAPAPPAPAPPVVQPQPQPQAQAQAQTQVQTQVQPLTAAAMQQQEELQLALALMADEAPRTELAMVDRRRGEQLRALALVSASLGAASVFGLARLRTRREDAVRVRRVR